ncbi:MAG: hypothetical protein MUO19_03940, partial [Dehalococcoidales bacterium]|nr:hypothetical protein [Dehalococcoidales bacterium]
MILKKPFRWLGIVVVLTLMLALIPATPALAWYDLTLSKTSATIGDTITFTGLSFSLSAAPPGVYVYAIIYISNQNSFTAGQQIVAQVTTYSTVAQVQTTATGTVSGTITIPSKFSSNNSNVIPGAHTLYVTESTSPTLILKTYPITVLGNAAMTISPLTGEVDSTITITGTSFMAST